MELDAMVAAAIVGALIATAAEGAGFLASAK